MGSKPYMKGLFLDFSTLVGALKFVSYALHLAELSKEKLQVIWIQLKPSGQKAPSCLLTSLNSQFAKCLALNISHFLQLFSGDCNLAYIIHHTAGNGSQPINIQVMMGPKVSDTLLDNSFRPSLAFLSLTVAEAIARASGWNQWLPASPRNQHLTNLSSFEFSQNIRHLSLVCVFY